MDKKIAVYPGSFDPPTLGHMDVIERAAVFFDHLYVVVAESYEKNSVFTLEERLDLLNKVLPKSAESKIEVTHWHGLTTEFVKEKEADCIIRGVRSSQDFRMEQTLANINSELYVDCETLLFCCRPQFRDISSSTVKEIAKFGGALNKFVPKYVEEKLRLKYNRSK